MKKLLFIFLLMVLTAVFKSYDISKEELSTEELNNKVKIFNDWFHNKYPNLDYLEARIIEDGTIRTFTTKQIKEDEVFLTLNKDMILRNIDIYSTKYADVLREVEEFYGYDDITNFALLLVIEKHNPDSHWKPYLDLLPSKPQTLLYNYWDNKLWVEHNLGNIALASKFSINLL